MRVMVTHSRCRISERHELSKVIERAAIGDWFILDLLSRNLDPANFKDLVRALSESK